MEHQTQVSEKSLLFSMSGYGFLLIGLVLLAAVGYSFLQSEGEINALTVILVILAALIFKGL